MKLKDVLAVMILFLNSFNFNNALANETCVFSETKTNIVNQTDFYVLVKLNGVNEFLNKLGFIVEKEFPQEIFNKVFYKSVLFGQKLYPLRHYVYIRSLFNKERVDIFEFDNKITSNDEMLGDAVLIFSKDKIIDFRYYNYITKTKHIWYDGDEPVPCLPTAGDNSKNSAIKNSLL